MRISDWSSDVCSSDLVPVELGIGLAANGTHPLWQHCIHRRVGMLSDEQGLKATGFGLLRHDAKRNRGIMLGTCCHRRTEETDFHITLSCRSEEHTSELQSIMRISYYVIFWEKKNTN